MVAQEVETRGIRLLWVEEQTLAPAAQEYPKELVLDTECDEYQTRRH
jgi:hypothetical protein